MRQRNAVLPDLGKKCNCSCMTETSQSDSLPRKCWMSSLVQGQMDMHSDSWEPRFRASLVNPCRGEPFGRNSRRLRTRGQSGSPQLRVFTANLSTPSSPLTSWPLPSKMSEAPFTRWAPPPESWLRWSARNAGATRQRSKRRRDSILRRHHPHRQSCQRGFVEPDNRPIASALWWSNRPGCLSVNGRHTARCVSERRPPLRAWVSNTDGVTDRG